MYKDDSFFFLQYLKFSILDWTKPSQDPLDQESMGSMECSLAEILAASSKARFERGLTPFRHTLGMCTYLFWITHPTAQGSLP